MYVLEFKEFIQYPCLASNRYIIMCLFMCLDLRIFCLYDVIFHDFEELVSEENVLATMRSFIRRTRLIDFICAYLCLNAYSNYALRA